MAILAHSRFAEFAHHMPSTLSRIWKRKYCCPDFKRIHYDQAYEQSNKTIKSIKGPIDFVNRVYDVLQRRWEIAGPEIAEYLEQVESKILKGTNRNDTHHHEDNPTHILLRIVTKCVLSSMLYQKLVKNSIKNLLIHGLSDARNFFLIQLRKVIL